MTRGSWWKGLLIAVVIVTSNIVLGTGAEAAVLRMGDRNSDVMVLQERLVSLGYDVGGTDGIFGRQTAEAVKDLQALNGLEADGIVGDSTWDALRSGNIPVSRSISGSASIGRILLTSQRYLGVPYLWGGSTPDGFDCSGFIQYVFALNNIGLPRTADVQYGIGMPVDYAKLQPGDLVFFTTYAPGPSHNGIYLGNGKFINATSSRGVAIDRMDSSYWGPRYIGARRVTR